MGRTAVPVSGGKERGWMAAERLRIAIDIVATARGTSLAAAAAAGDFPGGFAGDEGDDAFGDATGGDEADGMEGVCAGVGTSTEGEKIGVGRLPTWRPASFVLVRGSGPAPSLRRQRVPGCVEAAGGGRRERLVGPGKGLLPESTPRRTGRPAVAVGRGDERAAATRNGAATRLFQSAGRGWGRRERLPGVSVNRAVRAELARLFGVLTRGHGTGGAGRSSPSIERRRRALA
ncbi:hypothetical protein BDY21DRAFT_368448 [Lineolata rhizophorae]|uniref:Uncharacterized protein n=1 Tax=Lineolata rhizophorae TaxID=578093 RepID=A0A6A6PEJ2_9PEZI|nr:hypothetical protein BDY21DRAFT_368448 [Lineolata rhizophorae]